MLGSVSGLKGRTAGWVRVIGAPMVGDVEPSERNSAAYKGNGMCVVRLAFILLVPPASRTRAGERSDGKYIDSMRRISLRWTGLDFYTNHASTQWVSLAWSIGAE